MEEMNLSGDCAIVTRSLLNRGTMLPYDKIRVYLDEEFESAEKFTVIQIYKEMAGHSFLIAPPPVGFQRKREHPITYGVVVPKELQFGHQFWAWYKEQRSHLRFLAYTWDTCGHDLYPSLSTAKS
ncbi:hypothetical protein SK128_003609 [Halocaridina rubra]|uniref:Uncharacterized protein n=1 Tax=Halocaridina rubra TaxID=373956 RepID=A0AAN8WJ76_HALRR